MNPVDLGALPPIQLAHFVGINAPLDQGIADTQRGEEVPGFVGDLQDGLMVQVIVVVVGQDHRFDFRQFIEADRWLVEPFGAGPLHRGGTLGKHRIGQPEFVAQF
ncbi:hypothetical protein D3C80_1474480 [compost metagenome]